MSLTLSSLSVQGWQLKERRIPPSIIDMLTSLEMELLKGITETGQPLVLVLVPFLKGKESQNYNTLYNLLITALIKKKKPSKSILSATATGKSLI